MEDTGTGKREYKKGARKYNTNWLPRNCSLDDGDYSVYGNGLNYIEFKRRTPILNRCQMFKFCVELTHVFVYENVYPEDPSIIEADEYEVWCPRKEYGYDRVRQYSYLLTSYARDNPTRITKDVARRVLSGHSGFPCCGRYTFKGSMAPDWLQPWKGRRGR
jgi:hypothetical protein